ncbi:TAG-68 protein [Aphelenchoides avenae]|nr:TAG-68 protein [Aphelenchus avenae]
MPWDCGFLCLLTDRRRYIEILWRKRLLITNDEKKAKRRFMSLMRGFDTEDLDVIRRAVETNGRDIRQCAPGPPMDLVEEEPVEEAAIIVETRPGSGRRRHSVIRIEHDRAGSGRAARQSRTRQSLRRSPRGRRRSSVVPNNVRYAGQRVEFDENANAPPRIGVNNNELMGQSTEEDDQQPSTSRPAGLGEFEDCGLIPQIDRPMSMPYLCCKMWRWKELQVDAALHRLDPMPWCRFGRVTINNATVSCCNPFHYGLWIRPELSTSSEEQSMTGTVANGGFHISGGDHTGDTGFGDEITGTSGIGHVRSTFQKSVEFFNIDVDAPPATPPPPVPNTSLPTSMMSLNHIPTIHATALAWGKMARWERKERIGEMVSLVGQFVAVGKLADTVHDGQDVKTPWDIENNASFALIRQSESEFYEDVWLYNSGDRPLFFCVSQSLNSARSDSIRRLSPGYCIRVHRTPLTSEVSEIAAMTRAPDVGSVSFLTISIGVGWGVNYQRLYVTETPCRYEIIFS